MTQPPPTPTFLPLDREQALALTRLVESLDTAGLHWLAGYAQGLAAARAQQALTTAPPAQVTTTPAVAPAPPAVAAAARPVTILFGSQTGHSKEEALALLEDLQRANVPARALATGAYAVRELANEETLVVVISTQGDGDPPDDAIAFCEAVHGKRAPALPKLSFAVLALGDSSYPKFCSVGRALDERFAALGAARLAPRVDCDVDYQAPAAAFRATLVQALQARAAGTASTGAAPIVLTATVGHASTTASKHHPAPHAVLANQRLTATGAPSTVHHLELQTALAYAPGDALSVWPTNPQALVREVITALSAKADDVVDHAGKSLPLSTWLSEHLELTRLSVPVVKALAERAGDADRLQLVERGGAALQAFIKGHQVVELVQELLAKKPGALKAVELVSLLKPLTPRAYSIASSPLRSPGEVHLTVARVCDERGGKERVGAASFDLCARKEGDVLRAFVDENPRFRLPADDATDLILIGPGTGVAPFRAFLQEREERQARGKSWLFFGAAHRHNGFLYQLEWLEALKRKSLHALDVAFSRDQAHKIYVQHRLRERGAALWAWLAGGARVYVCGDAHGMAPAVEEALLDIARAHGGRDDDGAKEWLAELRQQGRYLRDVY